MKLKRCLIIIVVFGLIIGNMSGCRDNENELHVNKKIVDYS